MFLPSLESLILFAKVIRWESFLSIFQTKNSSFQQYQNTKFHKYKSGSMKKRIQKYEKRHSWSSYMGGWRQSSWPRSTKYKIYRNFNTNMDVSKHKYQRVWKRNTQIQKKTLMKYLYMGGWRWSSWPRSTKHHLLYSPRNCLISQNSPRQHKMIMRIVCLDIDENMTLERFDW